MSYLPRLGQLPLLALAMLLSVAGCKSNEDQVAASANPSGASDPASANLAPVASDSGNATPAAYRPQQSSPASNPGGNYAQPSDRPYEDSGYGEQPVYTSDQSPPPLPNYDQPQAPGDDYLWTPGYWAYAPEGYYWVPGAWTEAPYEGALWTPGYWGYRQHHYQFYRGYWGQYVGFYGGVDYGFGYVGYGYQGGYWGGGHFNYNRSVNNVDVRVVNNVYNRSVSSGGGAGARVSFNGGSGGIQVQARPAELAALRAPHTAPMGAQLQNERAAGANRAQFASVTQGHPGSLAVSQPLTADRNVRAPAALQAHNREAAQIEQRQAIQQPQQRQATAQQEQRQAAPQPQQPQRPAIQQPQQRQAVPQQEQRPATPQQHQAVQEQRRAAPQPQQPQRQAVQEPPQRRVAPQESQPQRQAQQQQQQRQAVPPQQQRPATPQQHQAAPEQRQAAPQHAEEHPKK